MRRFKKIVSTFAAAAVLAASAVMVMADPEGQITIKNATIDSDYAAYKIFDAQVTGDDVRYTVIDDASYDDFYDELFAAGSPFSYDDATGVVTLADGADAITYLKGIFTEANIAAWDLEPEAEVTATSSTIDLAVDYGYYFVTSTLGSVVSITSATPNVNIIDKNQGPSWEPEDPDDYDPEDPDGSVPNGKFVSSTGLADSYGKTSTATFGDTEYFKINSYAPKYNGETQIVSYIFTDTLAAGFDYNDDAALSVNGTAVTEGFTAVATENNDGTTTIVFTYVLPADYEASDLSITYTADVNEDAVPDNVNTVAMDWTYIPYVPEEPYDPSVTPEVTPTATPTPSDTRTPSDPTDTPDDSTTDTYVFSFEVIKYEESVADQNKIDGAEFRLYRDAECTDEIAVVAGTLATDGYDYRVAVAGETGVVIEAGDSIVFGLDVGTYYLKETKAPNDFNILLTPVTVTITAADTTDPVLVNVINNKGSVLPSTGGIGTTVFIVTGASVMVIAAAALILKKKFDENNSNEDQES